MEFRQKIDKDIAKLKGIFWNSIWS